MEYTRKIEKATWNRFFHDTTRSLEGKSVDIEIITDDYGDMTQCNKKRLLGVTYEEDTDTLQIACDGLDHMIAHPLAIYVEQEGIDLRSMGIIVQDGSEQIVKFHAPVVIGYH